MTHNINAELEHLAVPVETLTHFDGNARDHDLPLIAASLKANSQYRSIVVRRHEDPNRNNVVLAGNGTLAAARDLLGWSHVAAEYVECTDQQARRIVLVDNRANDKSRYHDDKLAELLKDLEGDYEGTGFVEDDLEDLLLSLQPMSLEQLEGEHGEPEPSDSWPSVSFKVPPTVMAAWKSHVDTCADEAAALAQLLEVELPL